MSRSVAFFILCVFGLFIFSIWTLVKFNDTYNMLTKHTQLSAWALAQLEIETLEFSSQLDTYLVNDTRSSSKLNLKYDILWNRYDTFLNSDETREIRSQFGSGEVVAAAFNVLRRYENAVLKSDLTALKDFSAELKTLMPGIRNLMIVNFTGEESARNRAIIAQNKQTVLYDMLLILFVLAYISLRVYSDAKYQQFMAWHDPLTKLKNRNYLLKQIEVLSKRNHHYALILLDISHFKEINDIVSYEYGDKILMEISERIQDKCDKFSFLCARVGADEFAILINRSEFNFEFFVKSLLSDLTTVLHRLDPSKRMTLSTGIALSHEMSEHTKRYLKKSSVILNNADLALHIAKRHPTESVVYYSKEMEIEHRKKRKLSEELEVLLKTSHQKQLYMAFQPIILRQSERLGCEALIRWNHPTHGFINPEYLIAIAEESGLAKALGRWIMQQVYQALSVDWLAFNSRIEVAINLSDSLFDEELPALVSDIFASNINYLDAIVLEITETMTLDEIERSVSIIRQLEDINIRLSLDDFGTGWSSLYNLNHLRFNKLKIDKSFVRDLNSLERQKFFISAIVTLSHQLGIKVVAEGVEDETQLHRLQELGVDEFQGYYFSKPVTKEEFARFSDQYFARAQPVLSAAE
ncbi:putative bifunctional diguanylate cyclase/phosphodiesterase [Vibrio furnissii]|uniref:putative bifunctional diguanylate cyclase/phosphodiesterase n=1 Tax=Vibrio furnissii TaxID=29494 RepID=UPI00374A5092